MICLKEQVQTKCKVQVEKRHKAITRTLIYSGLDLKKKLPRMRHILKESNTEPNYSA